MSVFDLPTLIRFALGCELLLVAVEKLVPSTHGVLPLGGDHGMQIGMLLVMTVGLSEIIGILLLWLTQIRRPN